ncbi:serine protease inhibitor dipetalogastin-like [Saccostrea echinata]|uniref:serine protease inhibitor dipetalogastin-like n=1 Tax=Saccostrea echinata TaxID=191078 RepID=UPI002A7FFA58|nr:serine protease inhibitor dipetalogastin-like [Saccostrea echinata]
MFKLLSAANYKRWNQKHRFLKCLERNIERDCKPLAHLELVFNDGQNMMDKISQSLRQLDQMWNRKWRMLQHKGSLSNSIHFWKKNRKFYRKFWKNVSCIRRSARTCGTESNDKKYRGRFNCLWRSGRVCGINGKTYKNACHAARLGIDVQYRGKCSSEWMLSERVPLCYDLPCLCKFTRKPDACCFKTIKRRQCEEILSKWESLCNGTSACRCHYCDKCEYSPVCSRKGLTYDNICKLGCVDDDEFACNGTCPCTPIAGPEVCGADGLTYTSPDQALEKDIGIICDHPCPCSSNCVCNDTRDPVCGEDDVTYDNACKAKCSDVTIACNNPCPCKLNPCKCDDVVNPVCGSDAKTYLNSCHATCAKVEIACETCCPCPEIQPICSYCQYEYNFVCGANNVTYANACCAECVGVLVKATQPCVCQTQNNL